MTENQGNKLMQIAYVMNSIQ